MNLKHEFNRISHLFNDGVDKTRHQAGHWACQGTKRADDATRRVRDRVDTGARNIVTVEEAVVRHLRENPALYVFGVALLVGVLIAKLLLEARPKPQAPLL